MIQCSNYDEARLAAIYALSQSDSWIKSITITYDEEWFWVDTEDFDIDEIEEERFL